MGERFIALEKARKSYGERSKLLERTTSGFEKVRISFGKKSTALGRVRGRCRKLLVM